VFGLQDIGGDTERNELERERKDYAGNKEIFLS